MKNNYSFKSFDEVFPEDSFIKNDPHINMQQEDILSLDPNEQKTAAPSEEPYNNLPLLIDNSHPSSYYNTNEQNVAVLSKDHDNSLPLLIDHSRPSSYYNTDVQNDTAYHHSPPKLFDDNEGQAAMIGLAAILVSGFALLLSFELFILPFIIIMISVILRKVSYKRIRRTADKNEKTIGRLSVTINLVAIAIIVLRISIILYCLANYGEYNFGGIYIKL